MKAFFIFSGIIAGIFFAFQLYTTMATGKTETQAYKLIRAEAEFEIRYYPAAVLAKVASGSKSYRDLGYLGFGKLARFIFGGNSAKKQIAMTSPVHMEIGDSVSSMAFVMPANLKKEDLPEPDNAEVYFQTSEPEFVAAMQFGGFATTERIDQHKLKLQNLLKEKGISYSGNFRFLGYNPPYQLFGRKNEVIVAVDLSDSN